ncbi:P63C domain-containing protein [Glomus cerebriforme]|uniref:P63C domain-containing protein n=1 Tax=Glomus cerebriforme TaxID=658196 RepID=A0A397TEC5_9GLOM|nr:P63C domain-containing protein [Glomus cerebriforme]
MLKNEVEIDEVYLGEFNHQRVIHKKKQYVNSKASTNCAENFNSHLKRGIYGTHHWKKKVIRGGELDLAGYKIPCFVLEDGTRVLSSRGMQDALKIVDESDKQKRGPRLKYFLAQKSLQPFIDKEKKRGFFEPIICYKGKTEIRAYEATLLPDICIILSDLEKESMKRRRILPTRQAIVAKQCELLLKSFAKVGIIGLVDEATGYQYERERFELNKIFKLLILEDGIFSEAKKMFPLDYYKELFEVYNVDFTAENIRRKPRFIGWLTSELVYKNLPKGSFVLEKIKERTPKTKGGYYGKRFYRSLTPEGRKALEERINTVKTIA